MSNRIIIAILASIAVVMVTPVFAEDQDRQQLQPHQIYGYQLMNDQERNSYRARMHKATTLEERNRIRNEHHELMQKRAAERGIKLPDEAPMHGMDSSMGSGMGSGMGPGTMGPGGGGRR